MPKVIAQILVILGSILIGLGIGIMVGQATEWKEYLYWLSLAASLILGGFILALGMTGKKEKKEPVGEIQKEEKEKEAKETEKKD